MQRSTIGDAELNDPVRNGKGWDLSAITTLIIVLMFYCFNVLRTNSKPTQKHKGLTIDEVKDSTNIEQLSSSFRNFL